MYLAAIFSVFPFFTFLSYFPYNNPPFLAILLGFHFLSHPIIYFPISSPTVLNFNISKLTGKSSPTFSSTFTKFHFQTILLSLQSFRHFFLFTFLKYLCFFCPLSRIFFLSLSFSLLLSTTIVFLLHCLSFKSFSSTVELFLSVSSYVFSCFDFPYSGLLLYRIHIRFIIIFFLNYLSIFLLN